MIGSNRINAAGLVCSCLVQGALLGALIWGIAVSPPRSRAAGEDAPLVFRFVPLAAPQGQRGKAEQPSQSLVAAKIRSIEDGRPRNGRTLQPDAAPPSAAALPAIVAQGHSGAVAMRLLGAVSADALSDYQRRLNERIARNSRYPAEARRQRLAGVTKLAFTLDRTGTVLDSWIQESSGSESLDSAAIDALDRASPLPPIPVALPDKLDFVVEIDLSTASQ